MADDYSISAKITADTSGFESGISKAQNASKNLSKTISGVIQGLGKSGLVGALGAVGLASQGVSATFGSVVKIAKKVSQAIGECTESYRRQYQAELALETAVNNSPYVDGTATRALKQFASEMQTISNLGDEEVLPMMTQLIATGRTEAETMDIIRVATDMSATGTMSFDTAVTQLNATLNGNVGRLGQQNSELKNLTEEELKNGKAVEILGNKYKGLAQTTADTSKQLRNALGDLKENLGKVFETALAPMRKFFTEVITNLNNSISKSRELKDAMKEAFNGDEINIDATTDSLKIAFDEVLNKQREITQNYQQYLKLYGKFIDETTDETAQAYTAQIKELNIQLRTISEELNKRRRETEKQKQARKEAEEQAEQEKKIIELKEKYLTLIAEQETKWRNIKTVTGEAVKNEEKLKFYQEQLVAIMTESGGKITENNQYYKDQKKIIDELIKLIGEEAEVVEETESDIVISTKVATSQLSRFLDSLKDQAQDWSRTIETIYSTFSQSFQEMFNTLGQELVEGGLSWQNYSTIALKAIAEVLNALGAQLSVMAVAKAVAYDYQSAVLALVGSVSAFTASGVLTGVANTINKVSDSVYGMTLRVQNAQISLNELKNTFSELQGSFNNTVSAFAKTMRSAKQNVADAKAVAEQAYKQYKESQDYADLYYEVYLKQFENLQRYPNLAVYYDHLSKIEEWNKLKTEASQLYDVWLRASEQESNAFVYMSTLSGEIANNYYQQIKAINDTIESYDYFYEKIKEVAYDAKIYQSINTNYQVIFEEQLLNIKKSFQDMYTAVTNAGKDIGATLVTSIVNGATKQDFLLQMKDFIRENLIKLSVYTESFQDKLARIGTKMATALMTGTDLKSLRTDLEKLWKEASKNATKAENIINEVFGDINKSIDSVADNIDETIDAVEEKLTTFEQAMQGFKETVSDLGGDLASNLVDSISEGLTQSDFLQNMKQWIRKMLIQSVVYTESMKAEIEAIGKAITKGISQGFTATTFHEVRRDLSYVFDQANKTIGSIDKIINSVFGSGYATGTNNATSGLHLVGEAGPELIRFRGGEQVYNAKDTQNMMSNGKTGNTFNVTFNNTQDTTAFAMMQQLRQYNRQLAINGIF